MAKDENNISRQTFRRISKENYYLNIAQECSRRGTCLRRNYGAVIVNHDEIVSTGYTGSPRGRKNCSDHGQCLRNELNIPPGERYEICRSVHAEVNACLHASRKEMLGGVMYLCGVSRDTGEVYPAGEPCEFCKRVIINAGIEKVVIRRSAEEYEVIEVRSWLEEDKK
jgi:dCMP deaminase